MVSLVGSARSQSPGRGRVLVLPTRATPVPATRNQILNQSLHAIREPGPLVFHHGAHSASAINYCYPALISF